MISSWEDKATMPGVAIERFQFFTIRTSDLQTAYRFYVELLGFPVIREEPGNFFQVSIAGVPVCVDLHPDQHGWQPNQIGVEVSDLAATVKFLQGKGCQASEGSRPNSGERWAAIKDPDGHEIIFLARSS